MTTNEENWLLHYNELKEHIIEHHRLPQKTVVEGRSSLVEVSAEEAQGRIADGRADKDD